MPPEPQKLRVLKYSPNTILLHTRLAIAWVSFGLGDCSSMKKKGSRHLGIFPLRRLLFTNTRKLKQMNGFPPPVDQEWNYFRQFD